MSYILYIYYMKELLLIFFLVFNTLISYCSHVVGGDLTYRCLGGSDYEITLKLYRDCSSPFPLDNFIQKVYNGAGTLVTEVPILFESEDTLDILFNYPCTAIPSDVCLNIGTYKDTLNLPDTAVGGYTIILATCCRTPNSAIVNLDLTNGVGISYYVTIPEGIACNSSPVFNNDPPIALCLDQPFSFDHSATDTDGDLLVYKLCTPLDNSAGVIPPSSVPYNAGYSADNPIDASPVAAINPNTGLLAFTPTMVGLFAIGICVEEYRGGVLIGQTNRDFLFSVADCPPLTDAVFSVDIRQCGQMVAFTNESQGSTFTWDFGDATVDNDSSSQENPIYTYEDTGNYEVQMIVDPNTPCADTAVAAINIERNQISADLSLCDDVSITLNADTPIAIGYDWSTGDTTSSIRINEIGQYLCEIETESSCIEEVFNVLECDNLFVPNVFSPQNQDGLNDVFTLRRAQGTDNIVMQIYDRWGKKVFESSPGNTSWDGIFQGKFVATGVYIYTISVIGGQDNRKDLPIEQGTVTVLE